MHNPKISLLQAVQRGKIRLKLSACRNIRAYFTLDLGFRLSLQDTASASKALRAIVEEMCDA
jgi:hypothetical protein